MIVIKANGRQNYYRWNRSTFRSPVIGPITAGQLDRAALPALRMTWKGLDSSQYIFLLT